MGPPSNYFYSLQGNQGNQFSFDDDKEGIDARLQV